jgi:hypothetical protein
VWFSERQAGILIFAEVERKLPSLARWRSGVHYRLLLTIATVIVVWRFVGLPWLPRTVKISAAGLIAATIVLPYLWPSLSLLAVSVQIAVALSLAIYMQVFRDSKERI